MSEIEKMVEIVNRLRDERDWRQFHDAKSSAAALVTEAAELLEILRFTSEDELDEEVEKKSEELSDELADTLFWVLVLSDDLGIDLMGALREKIKKTEKKYPIEKAKGNREKWTDYED